MINSKKRRSLKSRKRRSLKSRSLKSRSQHMSPKLKMPKILSRSIRRSRDMLSKLKMPKRLRSIKSSSGMSPKIKLPNRLTRSIRRRRLHNMSRRSSSDMSPLCAKCNVDKPNRDMQFVYGTKYNGKYICNQANKKNCKEQPKETKAQRDERLAREKAE